MLVYWDVRMEKMKIDIKYAIKHGYHAIEKRIMPMFLIVFMEQSGLGHYLKYQLRIRNEKKMRVHPSEDMIKARRFYLSNRKRVEGVIRILADKQSKRVFKEVLKYRMYKRPLPRYAYSEGDQYFPSDIIKLKDGEVFVDAGGYIGDTVGNLLSRCEKAGVKCKKIVVFEPNTDNAQVINRFFGGDDRIIVIKKGLSEKEDTIAFFGEGTSYRQAYNDEENSERIKVVPLDLVEQCKDATFIKMDIEGAEYSALKGCEKIITRNHPKLAICLYHSDEDMLRIIEYIHDLLPQYRIYVRHHTRYGSETVMYAVLNW